MKKKAYTIQWLEEEELWYLTIHEGNEGITFEGWYYSIDEVLKDIDELVKEKEIQVSSKNI